jgi:hypothetical protein
MKEKLLPLSILALALAFVSGAAIWGVVADRQGQRRDQPPWPQYERRTRVPDRPARPIDCAEVTKKRYNPDNGPGGVFEIPGYAENWQKPTDVDREFNRILGCETPETP